MPSGIPKNGINKGQFTKGRKTWNKGIPLTEEVKEKLRNKMKGRLPWCAGKKRPEISGEKNNFWKGGITSENKRIRESIEYKSWRTDVFERDGFICQMPECEKTERYLNAHHIKRFIDYPELRLSIDNGITLCKKCHDKTKGKEEKYEELFLSIINLNKKNEKL